jgi:hypothetical protein
MFGFKWITIARGQRQHPRMIVFLNHLGLTWRNLERSLRSDYRGGVQLLLFADESGATV